MPRFTKQIVMLILCVAWIAPSASAKYYKYRDENGVLHFSDDYGHIPDHVVEKMETIAEPYDHLTPKERRERIEADREKVKALQKKTRMDLQRLEYTRQLKEERKEEMEREKREMEGGGLSTPIDFKNNSIFVNVSIGYHGKSHSARLLLDTGATSSVLHQAAAKRMGLDTKKGGKATLAGGKTTRFRNTTLDFISLGPKKAPSITVSVINYKSKNPGYDGLLGMDFLQHFPHVIDTKQGVINWAP